MSLTIIRKPMLVSKYVVIDHFDRTAQTGLGVAETGQAWTNDSNTHGIFAGGIAGPDGLLTALVSLPAVANFDTEVKIRVADAGVAELRFRISDNSNYIIAGIDNRVGETDFEMWKNNAGVFTNLIDYNVAPVLSKWHLIRVLAVESILTMYVDGALAGSVTETFNQTATRIGFYTASSTESRYNDLLVRRV